MSAAVSRSPPLPSLQLPQAAQQRGVLLGLVGRRLQQRRVEQQRRYIYLLFIILYIFIIYYYRVERGLPQRHARHVRVHRRPRTHEPLAQPHGGSGRGGAEATQLARQEAP